MDKAGDNAYDLYRKSGVRPSTTYRFLNSNHGEPIPATVRKWAQHYRVTEAQLRGLEPIPGMRATPPPIIAPPTLANLVSSAEYAHFINMRQISKEGRHYVYRLAAFFAKQFPAGGMRDRRRKAIPGNPQKRLGEAHYAPVVRAHLVPGDAEDDPEIEDLFRGPIPKKTGSDNL